MQSVLYVDGVNKKNLPDVKQFKFRYISTGNIKRAKKIFAGALGMRCKEKKKKKKQPCWDHYHILSVDKFFIEL